MASSHTVSGGSRSSVTAGLLILVAAVGVAWWYRSTQPPPPKPANDALTPAVVHKYASTRAVKPQPASQGFVGSEACTTCHSEIAHRYEHQPMHIAGSLVPGYDVEAYDERTVFQAYGGRTYRVERKDDGVYHHELMTDANGDVIFDQAARILLAIGSGTRGRTYAIDRDGMLFESPISWYSSGDGKWDLSPGYEKGRHQRFERRIGDQCVECHSGRVNPDPQQQNRFLEPVVLEAGIGCERCHGPGEQHVARQQSDKPPEHDDSIVNPANLPPEKREAVCNQCHLLGKGLFLRYGRSFYDFRPGQSLDDVWLVQVEDTGVTEDGRTKAVSHVQQMLASACYRGSEGRMGCITCHDSHEKPPAESTAAYYRERCLNCHSTQGCSLPEEKRIAPPAEDSCIHCHMPRLAAHDIPHASQTDHRVVREMSQLDPPGHAAPGELKFFDDADRRLPEWERDRVYALALLEEIRPGTLTGAQTAERAAALLRATLEVAPDDVRGWGGLGRALVMQQKFGDAQECLRKGLEISPNDEELLELAVHSAAASQDFPTALKYLNRLAEVNPWVARNFITKAEILLRIGNLGEAIQAAEKALDLDPTQLDVRKLLVDAYTRTGNREASNRHADILRRLSEAMRSRH